MGLIRAAMNAVGGTLKDQYKEFIYCEALPMDVLLRKGQNQFLAGGTNQGNSNVISDGSRVAISDGQCMLIVEDGKVVDFSAESGEYIYKTGTTPSMLTGGMEGLKKSISTVIGRIQTGGQQEHDQRVYYVNTKEIMGNKVGAGDIPFRDSEFNFTMKLKCFGEYSYKLTDPIMFYTNVAGNVNYQFTRDLIDSQFKAEVQTSLQPALGKIALKRIPYDQLPLFTKEIASELNSEMTSEWVDKRGISVVSFALASVTPDADSAKKIEQFQSSRVYTDVNMLGARIGEAQANAMENAAKNENGAMNAFIGMGMAQNAGGMNASQLFQMGAQTKQNQQAENPPQPAAETPKAEPKKASSASSDKWSCSCGVENTGKFCAECGNPAPIAVKPSNSWTCTCGVENTTKFCSECGMRKPYDSKCETCGFEGPVPFKFCPECGAENKI